MMSMLYDTDVVAWAEQQARLLRTGQLSLIDIENIAEEIEDVGKREKQQLASRLTVLMMHLLKWKFQPERQGASWRSTIRIQRLHIERQLKHMPSLKVCLADAEWMADVWEDAVMHAGNEAGLIDLPELCPWSLEDVRSQDFLPD